jgi:hypothetical protein
MHDNAKHVDGLYPSSAFGPTAIAPLDSLWGVL